MVEDLEQQEPNAPGWMAGKVLTEQQKLSLAKDCEAEFLTLRTKTD